MRLPTYFTAVSFAPGRRVGAVPSTSAPKYCSKWSMPRMPSSFMPVMVTRWSRPSCAYCARSTEPPSPASEPWPEGTAP
ncbi:MAG: hypothetical protein QM767_06745 [Anaeromyxobacter sp.]